MLCMMKKLTIVLVATLFAACGGAASTKQQAAAPSPRTMEPLQYDYRVVATHPHSTDSYTQGLLWSDGVMWESTGLEGQSVLQRIDLATGRRDIVARLPRSEFGEGIAKVGDEIFYLTWHSNRVHVYDAASGREVREHRYAGEGWGLTTDGEKLYMSDGSENIHIVDPATFRRQRSITVTLKGEPVNFINEMEWIGGRIWANVYTTDQIVIINPANGIIEGVIDLTGILPDDKITPMTDVLNGIAHDHTTGRTWVTGKRWPKIYEIEITAR